MRPACPSYAGYRFSAEIISHAVWLYACVPLSLRMVDERLAARGILVSHETMRQWALKFGQAFANQIGRRLPAAGDTWHMEEVVLTIAGVKHWLWWAVDQTRTVLDILAQSRRDTPAAQREVMPSVEHRQHKGLNKGGGDLAPADPTARLADEAVHVSRPGAPFFVRP